MRKTSGRLKNKAARFRKNSVEKISEVFGPWVELPPGFGRQIRNRLFSPLKNLLVVPLPGAFRGRLPW